MSKLDEKAIELTELVEKEHIEINASFTLSDAIRLGSMVSEHNPNGWGDGDTACALTAAVIGAKAFGHL